MKSTYFTLSLITLVFMLCGNGFAASSKIGMLIEKENTATYEETLESFRRALDRSGETFTFEKINARNDRTVMKEIAEAFDADPAIDSVIVLGSAASAIASQTISSKPVICGGLNHPERLGISGDNVTGATYYISPKTVVNLITRLNPEVKKVGILYEPPDQNAASVVEVPETERALNAASVLYIKEEVRAAGDIARKTNILVEAGVDFIIIPTNKLLYSNVARIREVSDPVQVPVVSFSRKGVYGGAMIGITSNNYILGEKMAEMLMAVTTGEQTPKNIPWHFPEKYSILINEQTRADLGVMIPGALHRIATKLNGNRLKSEAGKQ